MWPFFLPLSYVLLVLGIGGAMARSLVPSCQQGEAEAHPPFVWPRASPLNQRRCGPEEALGGLMLDSMACRRCIHVFASDWDIPQSCPGTA